MVSTKLPTATRVVSNDNLIHDKQQQLQQQHILDIPMSFNNFDATTTATTNTGGSSNLQSALDDYKNSPDNVLCDNNNTVKEEDDNISTLSGGRGRSLTFGSKFDLSYNNKQIKEEDDNISTISGGRARALTFGSVLDDYKNTIPDNVIHGKTMQSEDDDNISTVSGGRGRALTFGSEFDLSLSFPMSAEDVVSGVIGSPVAEQVTVSSCESIHEGSSRMSTSNSEIGITIGHPTNISNNSNNNRLEACHENGSVSSNDGKFTALLSALSHTPPSLPNSLETKHFMKRQRSDSISGRLRSASELEENGWIDTQHKNIIKDLIVSGDTEVHSALDKYEQGDGSALQSLVKSGVLLGEKGQDIDLLGDLDLDFLTFNDFSENNNQSSSSNNNNAHIQPTHSSSSGASVSSGGKGFKYESDDGVGDLDFTFGSDHAECLPTENPELVHMPSHPPLPSQAHIHTSSNTSSTSNHSRSLSTGSMVESRLRSNTFGSLCDEILNSNCDNPFLRFETPVFSYTHPDPTQETKNNNRGLSPLTLTPSAATVKTSKSKTKKEKKVKEKKIKNIDENKKPRKNSKKQPQSQPSPEEPREPVPSGLGLPRSLSDPNLTTITDEATGLPHTVRPDGWVGAYSPTSRKMRIDRFLSKRNHRVWTKKVKYDVRKNFADSRLRVKGRFVKKEDEMLMRELLSLT